jgi:hypothetical protein
MTQKYSSSIDPASVDYLAHVVTTHSLYAVRFGKQEAIRDMWPLHLQFKTNVSMNPHFERKSIEFFTRNLPSIHTVFMHCDVDVDGTNSGSDDTVFAVWERDNIGWKRVSNELVKRFNQRYKQSQCQKNP